MDHSFWTCRVGLDFMRAEAWEQLGGQAASYVEASRERREGGQNDAGGRCEEHGKLSPCAGGIDHRHRRMKMADDQGLINWYVTGKLVSVKGSD